MRGGRGGADNAKGRCSLAGTLKTTGARTPTGAGLAAACRISAGRGAGNDGAGRRLT
jgi:hypothetical protein